MSVIVVETNLAFDWTPVRLEREAIQKLCTLKISHFYLPPDYPMWLALVCFHKVPIPLIVERTFSYITLF